MGGRDRVRLCRCWSETRILDCVCFIWDSLCCCWPVDQLPAVATVLILPRAQAPVLLLHHRQEGQNSTELLSAHSLAEPFLGKMPAHWTNLPKSRTALAWSRSWRNNLLRHLSAKTQQPLPCLGVLDPPESQGLTALTHSSQELVDLESVDTSGHQVAHAPVPEADSELLGLRQNKHLP